MKKTAGKEISDIKHQLKEAWSWGKKPKAPEPVPPPPPPVYTPPPPEPDKYEVITLSPKESKEFLERFTFNKIPKKGQPAYYYPYAKALCEGETDLRKVQPNIKLLCKHLNEWAEELEHHNFHSECGYISFIAQYYETGQIKLMRYNLTDKRTKLNFAAWYVMGSSKFKNYDDE